MAMGSYAEDIIKNKKIYKKTCVCYAILRPLASLENLKNAQRGELILELQVASQ